MSKRTVEDGQSERAPKKAKTQPQVEIVSARQLQQILYFQQDAIPQLRNGIKAFKPFLESIVYVEDKSSSTAQQAILKEFMEAERPRDQAAVFLSSLIQPWGFAAQTNNDGLLSAVTAILALLLKTVSSLIDFQDLARYLTAVVLDPNQVRILTRCLTAPKHKEHIISPALRLLTEAVSFDGGAQARKVFAAREAVFDPKTIARDLSLGHAADSKAGPDQPSVRSNTVHYLLANLRLQSTAAKVEVLKQNMIYKALFDNIRHDNPEIIKHILETFRESVIKDDNVPRKVKGYLFTPHNLTSIAGLMRFNEKATNPEHNVSKLAFDFLTFICAEPSAGVLRPSSGLYPPGTIKNESDEQTETLHSRIDLGLDSLGWYNSFKTHIPVRNGVLSNFLQQLKPYSNEMHRELLLSILRNAPELIADYFFKSSFAFDPKLTATWIGYSTFLFSLIQQPFPAHFGKTDTDPAAPPPVSVVIESILPKPLSSKVLTRCLNQSSSLITYFAIRIMILAFDKFQTCIQLFGDAEAGHGPLWEEATQRLQDEFSSRLPKLKDVIGSFRKLSAKNILQREATLRLIMLYYTTVPELASEESFDVSVILDEALDAFEKSHGDLQHSAGLRGLELGYLLQIGRRTSSTRWWHKPESLQFSPAVCLLKIVTTKLTDSSVQDMKELLSVVYFEHDILQTTTESPAIEALLASLKPSDGWSPPNELFGWLDDVLGRFVKKPIKYLDDLDSIRDRNGGPGPTSPVWMAFLEQWPFALSRKNSCEAIAHWLGRYLSLSKSIGEERATTDNILSGLIEAEGISKDLRKTLKSAAAKDFSALLLPAEEPSKVQTNMEQAKQKPGQDSLHIAANHFAPPSDIEFSSNDLHRAVSMDISDAVPTGALGSLILCLSSTDSDIRSQALTNLNTILKHLSGSQGQGGYSQARQMYLLLGVLCNTASQQLKAAKKRTPQVNGTGDSDDEQDYEEGSDEILQIPYTITIFAAMAAPILHEPTHPLYANVNKFLLRGPSWDADRLPSYWIHSLLRTPPADTISTHTGTSSSSAATARDVSATSTTATARFDRTLHPPTTLPASPPYPHSPYHASVHFLLSYAYHLLRSPTDLAILRRRTAFEPLFALLADPFLPPALGDLVFGLVWRATAVPGGSTALVTRAGVVAWLGGLLRQGRGADLRDEAALRALIERVWATCDRERVEKWADGTMEMVVQRLLKP